MKARIRAAKNPTQGSPRANDPELLPGISLTSGIRELLVAERETGAVVPNPLEAGQLSVFIDWLREVPTYSRSGLPRYMQAIFNEHEGLQREFPEVKVGELSRFKWWAETLGRATSPWIQILGHDIAIRRHLAEGGRVNGGVDVVGFFNAEHGIGESARLLVESLRVVNIPVSTLAYRNSESRQNFEYETDEVGKFRTAIVAINAELNEPMRNVFGRSFFDDAYVIGQWFWELEVAPSWYKPAYRHVNELWAPTKFIEEMLRRDAPPHVHIEFMPLPLRQPTVVENVNRNDLGLDDRYMFLFTFDFMSVMKRKNPIGLIDAFKKAFAPGEGPMLVLKCINGEIRTNSYSALQAAAKGRDDIIIVNKYLDSDMSAALMNLCDCYVSLHRSEGLGLTIAEAMLLGKPVIATGYSGNLDFMAPETSYMVPWTRVKVGKGAESYSSRATWAEPDLDVAAEMMRYVYQNPDEAQAKARAGKADLEARFTPQQTGIRMKARLEKIWETLNEI